MRKLIRGSAILAVLLLGTGTATATDLHPWGNHAAPFAFKFGNDIDTHQETRFEPDGDLTGFFYVRFTGIVTKDGYRVATHMDCGAEAGCTVGWLLSGKPIRATFLYAEMHDHPVFLVNRADLPQPGAFSHFHWLNGMPDPDQTAPGYVLELGAVDTFCFIHHEADAATGDKTCRDNGGIQVRPFWDTASHLNIVTSHPSSTRR
jgi:hypothetical protein